jgi:hypothetical protein
MPGCKQANLADSTLEDLTGCSIKQYINKLAVCPNEHTDM